MPSRASDSDENETETTMRNLNRSLSRLAMMKRDIRITPTWLVVSPVGSDGRMAHVVYASGASAWLFWTDLRAPRAPEASNVPNVNIDDLLNAQEVTID